MEVNMIESVSKTVDPSRENEEISFMERFGWALKSSQEVNVKESHNERKGDEIYSVTTQENYIKLVFQRDTSMPNYSRIKELEQEYLNMLNEKPVWEPPIFSLLHHLIFLVIAFCLFFIPGIIYIIFFIKSIKKRKIKEQEYREKYKLWNEKMETEGQNILDEIASLLK